MNRRVDNLKEKLNQKGLEFNALSLSQHLIKLVRTLQG